ncbi:sigma factor-like helix-turn-helix DNA-binding protein [Arthrobacter castelli]|uniref:sigma factor-like helix-turn-helix DNA-binding protein n=1 Tax=Arthrobacter castelli TaxID=271431 RepID=UPI00047935A4|nr:sigma factor-like helix-turn-helix DNA-binding protein [Arthrobacter castelli]
METSQDAVERLIEEARNQGEASDRHRHAMMAASRRRQEAILSLHALGLSVRQIAKRLGCSAGVVQSALKTAKSRRPVLERREERIPYELHVELVRALSNEGERLRKLGIENLKRMRAQQRNPVAEHWLAEWDRVLQLPIEEWEDNLLAANELGSEMRQMSPFAGALSDEERIIAIRKAKTLAPK